MPRIRLSLSHEPEKLFVIIGIVFGIIFLLITPPFQIPDEASHFYRAFQVSEGQIMAEKQQNIVGGLLPKSIGTTMLAYNDIPFHPEVKQKPEKTFALLDLPLNSQDRALAWFPNTSLYSPIPYLPQAVGIAIGRLFAFSPLILMYLGRFTNLLFWLIFGYLSIKITPVLKWTFFLLLLTPMYLFLAASLSADVTTNSISFLLIATILNYALVESRKIKNVDIFKIVVLSICLTLSKQAYFPIVLLFLLIPIRKIGVKKYFFTFGFILLGCIAATSAWSSLTKKLYVPIQPNISPNQQLAVVFDNTPTHFFSILLNTLSLYGRNFINNFIGTLGWLDTPLPVFFIQSYIVLLFVVSLVNGRKDIVISFNRKLIILLTFLLNIFLIFLLMYLAGTPVGANLIEGTQGRYFIPVAPLLFLLLYNQKISLNMRKFSLYIAAYSIFSASLTIVVLLHRYYYL